MIYLEARYDRKLTDFATSVKSYSSFCNGQVLFWNDNNQLRASPCEIQIMFEYTESCCFSERKTSLCLMCDAVLTLSSAWACTHHRVLARIQKNALFHDMMLSTWMLDCFPAFHTQVCIKIALDRRLIGVLGILATYPRAKMWGRFEGEREARSHVLIGRGVSVFAIEYGESCTVTAVGIGMSGAKVAGHKDGRLWVGLQSRPIIGDVIHLYICELVWLFLLITKPLTQTTHHRLTSNSHHQQLFGYCISCDNGQSCLVLWFVSITVFLFCWCHWYS